MCSGKGAGILQAESQGTKSRGKEAPEITGGTEFDLYAMFQGRFTRLQNTAGNWKDFLMIIIDLENIKLKSINNKYGFNPKSRRLYLTPEYRDFKNLLIKNAWIKQIDPPYNVFIEMESAIDIDNALKCILDALQESGCISDDKHVHNLTIKKTPAKRGALNKLRVSVEGKNE